MLIDRDPSQEALDKVAGCRGILNGLLLSLPFWIAAGFVIAKAVSR